MDRLIETGRIVNTHAVAGEVKIEPWADTPEFLKGFNRFFIGGTEYTVIRSRVHKSHVIAKLEGIDTVEDAMALKDKVVKIAREDATLPEGSHFISDILGFDVYDRRLEKNVGKLKSVDLLPAGAVYTIKKGQSEFMIPENGGFIEDIDEKKKLITVCTIEGMGHDRDED
ncbi:MAG: 16S rRNA processing protein RimM [Clostridiales bacterium]|nr:16S rRNA processing protein RimM [Clostridiales bacterium]